MLLLVLWRVQKKAVAKEPKKKYSGYTVLEKASFMSQRLFHAAPVSLMDNPLRRDEADVFPQSKRWLISIFRGPRAAAV